MEKKNIWNSTVQEGIFFLLCSGALFWHGMDSFSKGFNQDWSQSPYLFPVVVAILLGILAICLLCEGVRTGKMPSAPAAAGADASQKKHTVQVLVLLAITLAYYLALALLKIPYITFGILSWSLTISNFEIATVVFLIAMMLYLGVRKVPVLVLVPICTSLFLSVTFRSMLHVLLP